MRDNLPKKVKDGTYVTNHGECIDVGSHSIVFYVFDNDPAYFDSFGVEHVPKEIKRCAGNSNIQTNKFRIQAHASVMCEYSCIRFIHHMFPGKTLIDYTSLFLPHIKKKRTT